MDIEYYRLETGAGGNTVADIGLLSELPGDDAWAWHNCNEDADAEHHELNRRESAKWDDYVDALGEFFDEVDGKEAVAPDLFKRAERYVEHRTLSREAEHLPIVRSRKRMRL